jgi:DNA-binding CsgD family transcriptional regulator
VADLAAAAVRADRRMEGQDVLERALSHLGGTASARLGQLIARARGILADPAKSEAHFGTALADPAGDQWPFERAQLRLDYAEWLRRRRRINDAKPVLTEALGTFRRLGARSWAQRAQAELRACGVAVTDAPAERDALGELTPQQRQIVRLASDGLTNRQIGDRLFLSPRTVSSHLYRSYPKLGVAGRHQLRDVITRASTATPANESAGSEILSLSRFLDETSTRVRDLGASYLGYGGDLADKDCRPGRLRVPIDGRPGAGRRSRGPPVGLAAQQHPGRLRPRPGGTCR